MRRFPFMILCTPIGQICNLTSTVPGSFQNEGTCSPQSKRFLYGVFLSATTGDVLKSVVHARHHGPHLTRWDSRATSIDEIPQHCTTKLTSQPLPSPPALSYMSTCQVTQHLPGSKAQLITVSGQRLMCCQKEQRGLLSSGPLNSRRWSMYTDTTSCWWLQFASNRYVNHKGFAVPVLFSPRIPWCVHDLRGLRLFC